MTDFHFVVQNLGVNKVNVPIHTNDMIETSVMASMHPPSPFDTIEDIVFQRSASSPKEIKDTKDIKDAKERKQIKKVVQDHLMQALASQLDPTITLFSGKDLMEKLESFTKLLIDNLENHHQAYKKCEFKKHKIDVDTVKSALNNPSRDDSFPVLLYFAYLLKCNIMYQGIVAEYPSDRYLELQGDEWHLHESGFYQKRNASLKEKNLKQCVVKELRDIAEKLGVSIYHTEAGKKKLLTKQELISSISPVLEALK